MNVGQYRLQPRTHCEREAERLEDYIVPPCPKANECFVAARYLGPLRIGTEVLSCAYKLGYTHLSDDAQDHAPKAPTFWEEDPEEGW